MSDSQTDGIDSSDEDRISDTSPITPPMNPDDISRWQSHIDLQSFGLSLQAAANAIFPNTNESRYSKVLVLMLSWQDEDPNLPVSIEIEKLDEVFRDVYKFETQIWKIPNQHCHARLNRKILDFVTSDFDKQDEEVLYIVYYAGHAKLTRDRLLAWTSWRNDHRSKSPPLVQWSGIQNVLEQVESDVVILLDCCHAGTATASEGNKVTELISACAYNSRANGVGSYSFTKELVIELRDLSHKPSFTIAELYRNIFCRIQGRRPEDGTERHPAPIHLSLTQDDYRFPRSIQLSIRPNENNTTGIGHPVGSSVDQTSQIGIRGSPPVVDMEDEFGGSGGAALDSDAASVTAKVPRMLLAIRLNDNFKPGELSPSQFKEWLRNIPALVEEVRVEAGFDSFSTIIIASIPLSLSIYLPQDPAIIRIGPINSLNLIRDEPWKGRIPSFAPMENPSKEPLSLSPTSSERDYVRNVVPPEYIKSKSPDIEIGSAKRSSRALPSLDNTKSGLDVQGDKATERDTPILEDISLEIDTSSRPPSPNFFKRASKLIFGTQTRDLLEQQQQRQRMEMAQLRQRLYRQQMEVAQQLKQQLDGQRLKVEQSEQQLDRQRWEVERLKDRMHGERRGEVLLEQRLDVQRSYAAKLERRLEEALQAAQSEDLPGKVRHEEKAGKKSN